LGDRVHLRRAMTAVAGVLVICIAAPLGAAHAQQPSRAAKIKKELGFSAARTVSDAIVDLTQAFHAGKVPNAMTDDRYYNIKRMQALKLR